MTVTASKDLHVVQQSVQQSGLTKEQVFRLWRCAIKDDDTLVDEMIEHVYEDIVSFDRNRAESAMELTVRREVTAGRAFRSLLKDMRLCPSRATSATELLTSSR